MKKAIIVAILIVVVGYMMLPGSAPDDGLPWLTDMDAARAEARSENKPILVFFTGSDWCGWCKKLSGEILAKPEFQSYANEKLVLLKLDFPRRSQLPAAEQQANNALAQKYGIRGFPTIVLLDKYGNEVGRTGYQAMSPEQYIDHLERYLVASR